MLLLPYQWVSSWGLIASAFGHSLAVINIEFQVRFDRHGLREDAIE